jgi:hypothetical protein
MVVDRIERHDLVNAALLAAVLLLLGFGILTALRSLADTVDTGLIESTKDTPTTDATTADGVGTAADPGSGARPAGEVTVRVGNGAGLAGVAGAGTDLLQAAGYQTIPPKNAATSIENSVVYFAEGYGVDAEKVADVMGVDHAYIEPMPPDPGVPIDGAHVIVIVGANTAL